MPKVCRTESTFKTLKTEFILDEHFKTQSELDLALYDYVNCYNNIRFLRSFSYLERKKYKQLK
ncbi:IS3 family transposase [Amphibacillus xylanus]|uniref:IS3 family transposase n=1 Tax=Amphibacillus xylanus TaxID=1449 RepID=UPI00155A2412